MLTALGLGGALSPVLIILVMLVAIGSVHYDKGYFVTNGGWELNANNIAAAVVVAGLNLVARRPTVAATPTG